MVADRLHTSNRARAASFGAALAVNGALVAGLMFAAPNVLPLSDPPIFKLNDFTAPTPPPEPEPLPTEPKADTPAPPVPDDIFVPEPKVPTSTSNTVTTSTVERPYVIPLEFEPLPSPTGTGTGSAEPTPTPLPPLIAPQVDPRYARLLQPDYPAGEQRAGNEGSVVVRVLVGADGRIAQVEKVRATSDAFYEATRRQALTRWRFRPATRGGTPEPGWTVMTVRFEMNR